MCCKDVGKNFTFTVFFNLIKILKCFYDTVFYLFIFYVNNKTLGIFIFSDFTEKFPELGYFHPNPQKGKLDFLV